MSSTPMEFANSTDIRQAKAHIPKTRGSGFTLAVLSAALMILVVAGAVFGGKNAAFASIPFLICGVIGFALHRPVLAIAFYFTYAALEGMFKYLSDFSQAIYAIKPILALILISSWLVARAFAGKNVKRPPLAGLLLFWMAWGSVDIFFPTGAGVLGSTVTFCNWYLLPIGFYFLVYDVARSFDKAHSIMAVLMLLSTVISGFALVQYGMGKEWTFAHLPGYQNITQHNWWTTTSNGKMIGMSWSPASTTSYSGIASVWSNMGAVLSLGLLLSPVSSLARKTQLSALLIVNILALLISGERTYVLIFPLEALILFMGSLKLQRNPLHSVGLAILFVLLIGAGYVVAQNMSGGLAAGRYAATASNPLAKFATDRGGNFTSLGKFIQDYPFGVGYQRGTDSGDDLQPLIEANRESEFGAITADMGVPGLALLLLVMAAMLYKFSRTYITLVLPQTRIMALTILVLVLGIIISFFTGPTLEGADFFWTLAGVLVCLPSIERVHFERFVNLAATDPRLPAIGEWA